MPLYWDFSFVSVCCQVLMDLVHAHASSNTLDGIAQNFGKNRLIWEFQKVGDPNMVP